MGTCRSTPQVRQENVAPEHLSELMAQGKTPTGPTHQSHVFANHAIVLAANNPVRLDLPPGNELNAQRTESDQESGLVGTLIGLKISSGDAKLYAELLAKEGCETAEHLKYLDEDDLKRIGVTKIVHVKAILALASPGTLASSSSSVISPLKVVSSLDHIEAKTIDVFISHVKVQTGHTASLFFDRLQAEFPHHKCFLDAEETFELSELTEFAARATTLLLLSSSEYWSRPYCVNEIVVAHKNQARLLTVNVINPGEVGFNYAKHIRGLQGEGANFVKTLLNDSAWNVLQGQGIPLDDVQAAFEWFLQMKGTEYHPMAPSEVRAGEIKHIMRKLSELQRDRNQNMASKSSGETGSFESPSLRGMHELRNYYSIDFSERLDSGFDLCVTYQGDHLAKGFKVTARKFLRQNIKTEMLQNQIKALARLNHPNILRLYDVFFDEICVLLIQEFVSGGKLFDRLAICGAYSERDAARHFRDLASAIVYMHGRNIVHRDLKPENLVLTEPRMASIIKITDFAIAKTFDDRMDTMATVCGTKAYAAPERGFGFRRAGAHETEERYTAKVDVWSMGVILFELLGAYHPFNPEATMNDAVIWSRICSGRWDFNNKVWATISDEAKDLIIKMICVDPDQRLSMEQVLQHPWLQDLGCLPTDNLAGVGNTSVKTNVEADRPE